MKKISVLLILIMTLQGCIYSCKFAPEYSSEIIPEYEPIALSVGLGRVRVYAMGTEIILDEGAIKKEEESALRRMREQKYFKEVKAMGEKADLYSDAVVEADFTNKAVLAYYLILGPLTLVTPWPCPLPMKFRAISKIRAHIDGQDYYLREYHIDFTMRLWTASVWGAMVREEKLEKLLEEYLVPVEEKMFFEDYDFYTRLAKVVKAGDKNKIIDFINKNNQI